MNQDTTTNRRMNRHIARGTIGITIALVSQTLPGVQDTARASGPPESILLSRPSGAPLLSMPAYDRIEQELQRKNVSRIIVRLAHPDQPASAFAIEKKLREKADVENQRTLIGAQQSKVLSRIPGRRSNEAKRFDFIPFMALEVDQSDLHTIMASPEVDFIEEDIVVPPLLAQSVPLIGGENCAIDGYTGSGQTIAILDTGVEKTHPFLTGKVIAEACFSTTYTGTSTAYCTPSSDPGSGLPCSDSTTGCYHGTHVAGIAVGNNGPSGAPCGVAKDANIIAIQIFSRFSGSTYCGSSAATCPQAYNSDILYGLQYVYYLAITTSYNISSVNLSLGGGQYSAACDSSFPSFKEAVDNLRSVGIATVIAAGNNGYTGSLSFPACISTAISVGATDKSGNIASYSNSASFLTLLAPGSSIYSSLLNGSYGYLSGTSMATPHVAGAWAVLKSVNPSATVDDILTALTSTGNATTDSRNSIAKPMIQVSRAADQIAVPAMGNCGALAAFLGLLGLTRRKGHRGNAS